MDCSDVVVGVVQGNVSKITDSYTISRATPRSDEFYGGQQSLTAAFGYEENGIKTVVFRRPLVSEDPTDHDIVDEKMDVIWAKGQMYSDYTSYEDKVLAAYYERNVVKYHGKRNRGSFVVNFHD